MVENSDTDRREEIEKQDVKSLNRPVSAIDVAKRAGVSRTTVSFVLNNSPGKRISEKTRQRVLEAARELGYKPNEHARDLANTRHYSIGVFICHSLSFFSDAYIPKVIEGISQTLNKYRFRLILQPLKIDQSNYLDIAKADNLDGVIFINIHDNDTGFGSLIESGFPFVIIGTIDDKRTVQVDIDNKNSAKEAVSYLIKLGHKRIGMISHASTIYYAARERIRGYREAMEEGGLKVDETLIKIGDFSEESGYKAMKELLETGDTANRITAVFAGNDVIAYGAIKAIKDSGLRIPDDMSIVGFDDDYLSRYLNPPLTTIALPASGLGSEAARLLIQMISKGEEVNPKRVILPSYFSIRETCREL